MKKDKLALYKEACNYPGHVDGQEIEKDWFTEMIRPVID
jgi:hypothetical protein